MGIYYLFFYQIYFIKKRFASIPGIYFHGKRSGGCLFSRGHSLFLEETHKFNAELIRFAGK